MDLELSDEQRLIAETARDFIDNEIVPRARETDRAEKFDIELAAASARWATSARRSPRSTAAAASTSSATG